MNNLYPHTKRPVHGANVLLSLGVSFLLAACNGDSMPSAERELASPGTEVAEPCELVNEAEAEQALGAPVKTDRPPEANLPPRLASCRYTAERGAGLAVMTVMTRQGSSVSESKIGFASAKEQLEGVQVVQDVGDDAFQIGDQLHVLTGGVYLIIGGDIDAELAKQLAQSAVERLR
jgi:hypothetical protein